MSVTLPPGLLPSIISPLSSELRMNDKCCYILHTSNLLGFIPKVFAFQYVVGANVDQTQVASVSVLMQPDDALETGPNSM